MKKHILILLFLFTIIGITGCSDDEEEGESTPAPQPTPVPTPTPTPVPPTADTTITIYPEQKDGEVTLTGFSNTSSKDGGTQANSLKNFITGNPSYFYRDKTAFGKFHRIPITKDVDMTSVINYDNSIGRTPILLFEMDSIPVEKINEFLAAHQSYLSSVEWVEIGNEPWNYAIPDTSFSGFNKYSFDWRIGFPGAGEVNYANDLAIYVNAIRTINPNVKILISAAEGNFPWCCADVPLTQTILKTLKDKNIKIDGLAFHIYAERNTNADYPLKPYPNRYFAIPHAAIHGWSTYPVCLNQSVCNYSYYTGGIPNTLQNAIDNSGYNIINNKLVLFATEQALMDNQNGTNGCNPSAPQISKLRSSMLNALVYAGLVTQLSGKVQGILMHHLGYTSDSCYGFNGWDVLNKNTNMLPVGYAVKMLSNLQPLKVKTDITGIPFPSFNILNNPPSPDGKVSDDDGTVPKIDNVPIIYTLASINSFGNKLSVVIINDNSTSIHTAIKVPNRTVSFVSVEEMSPKNAPDHTELANKYIKPETRYSSINLSNFEVSPYSITVLDLSIN